MASVHPIPAMVFLSGTLADELGTLELLPIAEELATASGMAVCILPHGPTRLHKGAAWTAEPNPTRSALLARHRSLSEVLTAVAHVIAMTDPESQAFADSGADALQYLLENVPRPLITLLQAIGEHEAANAVTAAIGEDDEPCPVHRRPRSTCPDTCGEPR